MKISGAKTVLRRRKFFNSCPTQALCLMLVSGIVIAHFHVVTLPPSYWLLIMLAASAFAILVKNELHKSLLILAAFLIAGALLTRRNSTAVSNLTLAAIVMLIIQPLHLFDISFQLSFAAVLSILLLYKPIYSLLPASVTRRKPLGWAWAMVAVSVAAQVGTTPLVCYYFGNIACYSVLSSFVAIPAATVIIYVSLSLLLSFFLLPGFSLLQGGLTYLLSLTTSATQHALQLIVMLPGACIEGIKISILQLGLIYIAIIAGCLLIQKLHRCLLHRIHLPSDSHRDYSQQECQTSPSD